MMRSWMALMATGCGIFEGSEAPYLWPDCVIEGTAEVEDPDAAVLDLDPLGDRLDVVLGSVAIDAWMIDNDAPEGPMPGTLTIRQDGPILAEQRYDPQPEVMREGIMLRCASRYRVPVRVDLVLDDGLLEWTDQALEYSIVDEVDYGDGSHGDAVWTDASEATGSLDLSYRDTGQGPESLHLQVYGSANGLVGLVNGEGRIQTDDWESRVSWGMMTLCTDCETEPAELPNSHFFADPGAQGPQ